MCCKHADSSRLPKILKRYLGGSIQKLKAMALRSSMSSSIFNSRWMLLSHSGQKWITYKTLIHIILNCLCISHIIFYICGRPTIFSQPKMSDYRVRYRPNLYFLNMEILFLYSMQRLRMSRFPLQRQMGTQCQNSCHCTDKCSAKQRKVVQYFTEENTRKIVGIA